MQRSKRVTWSIATRHGACVFQACVAGENLANKFNQFEELVSQFIPSNMNWKGWVKMAFHQPLLPVLPVARELLSKTKWTSSKAAPAHESPFKLLHPRMLVVTDDDARLDWMQKEGRANSASAPPMRAKSRNRGDPLDGGLTHITSKDITTEPESIDTRQSGGTKRVKALFKRHKNSSIGKDSLDN